MWNVSIARAQLISLCLTTFLYGIFFTLFVITTAVMTRNVTERIRRQRKMILPMSLAMLLVATIHLIVVFVRGAYGFVDQKKDSSTAFYEDLSDPTHLLNMSCMCLQSAMGDCVMIWRMYIVYGKRILAVIPGVLLLVAYTVTAFITVNVMANARPGVDIFHVAPSWLTAYFSLTMATNIICTGAIAWQILRTGRAFENARVLSPIAFAIVESSALYTLGVVTTLSMFVSGSNAQYPAADAIIPLVGIAFSLIILQIRFHVNASANHPSDSPPWNVARIGASPVSDGDPEDPRRSIRAAAALDARVKPDSHTRASGDIDNKY